jgi:hypothetical protein
MKFTRRQVKHGFAFAGETASSSTLRERPPAGPIDLGIPVISDHSVLAVLTREVGDAGGGWFAAECGVAAVVIVGV